MRRAALVAIVAAASGCRWIPARKGDSPPATPPPVIGRATEGETPVEAVAAANLPPLPPLRSIGDDEAFRPSEPTPLLDAAAARTAAIHQVLATGADTAGPAAPTPIAVRVIAVPDEPATAETRSGAETETKTEEPPKRDEEVSPAAYEPDRIRADLPAEDAPPEKSVERPIVPPISEPPPPSEAGPVAQALPDAPEAGGSADPSLWETVMSALAVPLGSEAIAEPPADADDSKAEPAVPLAPAPEFVISDMRLCKKVIGFGRTEPLASSSCAAGQAVLLYSELEGLRDEESNDGFRSRLASTVAIVPATGGAAVWSEDLGVAEDHCRRRRRDFYVIHRLTLPADLAAGEYQLRLVQKDLLADRETSRSLPVTVRR